MMVNRRLSGRLVVVGGVALAAALLANCASLGATDPPAAAPPGNAAMQPAISAPEATPEVATEPPRERRQDAAGVGVRGGTSLAADDATTKSLKSLDAPTSFPRNAPAKSGVPVDPSAAGDRGGVPFIFAERRASEALDQLAGTVDVRHEKRGDVITLSCDKLVEPGQWALTASGRFALNDLARGLRDQDGHVILVQVYTDSLGKSAINDALSLRRAEAVREYLITQGVPAERLRAEGLGAKRPVAGNATPEGRAQNRRIEIVIALAP